LAAATRAEGHHPDISFGWGYATVGLQTKKIKGLHENDFIMATKIDQIFNRSTKNPRRVMLLCYRARVQFEQLAGRSFNAFR